MEEKYFYIEPEIARGLLSQIKEMKAAKRGVDRQAYLIGEYAVLTASKIKLRNVTTRDDDLAYFDEVTNHQPCWWFVVGPTGPVLPFPPEGGPTNHYPLLVAA